MANSEETNDSKANWVKNTLKKINDFIEKHKHIFEVIGLIVAIIVMINMWCTYGAMKDSVNKMRDQNRLSQESLNRMDSTIALMSEANKLTKNSLALAESSFAVEIRKFEESVKQRELQESEFIVTNRPRLAIVTIKADDIKEDSSYSVVVVHCTVKNNGEDDARDVVFKSFIIEPGKRIKYSTIFQLNVIQKRGDSKSFPIEFPKNVRSFYVWIEIDYNWKLPNGKIENFSEHKAYSALWDEKAQKYTSVKMLDEVFIKDMIIPVLDKK